MLYKIDYTKRSDRERESQFVDFVVDSTEAVKKFMNNFFKDHPHDAVRIEGITQVEIIGDASSLNLS
jgi:hypothetical protein